jgi:membrane protease subunit (stomatin/prohibitin family)
MEHPAPWLRLFRREDQMALLDFLTKQFIDVIQWTELEEDLLAYRYPMQDMEIQSGAQLTVRDSVNGF